MPQARTQVAIPLMVMMCSIGFVAAGHAEETNPAPATAPATPVPRERFVVREPGPSRKIGYVTVQPLRRVYSDGIVYTIRFQWSDESWEDDEDTMRQLVAAYDRSRGLSKSASVVIQMTWVDVEGDQGTYSFALEDGSGWMSMGARALGKTKDLMEAVRGALADIDRMRMVAPTLKPS
jgi:hypothetical protein